MDRVEVNIDGRVARVFLTVTEAGMLLYWAIASLVAFELIQVSPEIMYSDYDNPVVVSWNWSFFPLDVLFASTGLISRYTILNRANRNTLSMFSLSLMFCAGLMAISFWVIEQFFDPFWWGINLWLVVLPVFVVGLRLSQQR